MSSRGWQQPGKNRIKNALETTRVEPDRKRLSSTSMWMPGSGRERRRRWIFDMGLLDIGGLRAGRSDRSASQQTDNTDHGTQKPCFGPEMPAIGTPMSRSSDLPMSEIVRGTISGGHGAAEPPGPIPNPEVKRRSADGSGATGPVRVGRRQVSARLRRKTGPGASVSTRITSGFAS